MIGSLYRVFFYWFLKVSLCVLRLKETGFPQSLTEKKFSKFFLFDAGTNFQKQVKKHPVQFYIKLLRLGKGWFSNTVCTCDPCILRGERKGRVSSGKYLSRQRKYILHCKQIKFRIQSNQHDHDDDADKDDADDDHVDKDDADRDDGKIQFWGECKSRGSACIRYSSNLSQRSWTNSKQAFESDPI